MGVQQARSEFDSAFRAGDRVTIGYKDQSIIATVTAFQFRPGSRGGMNAMVKVVYMHNGANNSAWIEETRLTRVDP
jgi:hypothetical protein